MNHLILYGNYAFCRNQDARYRAAAGHAATELAAFDRALSKPVSSYFTTFRRGR